MAFAALPLFCEVGRNGPDGLPHFPVRKVHLPPVAKID
jgi:hypothetical protein